MCIRDSTGAVLPTDGLEHRPAAGGPVELLVDGCDEPVQAHGEDVEAVRRDRAAAQRVDHFTPALLRDRRRRVHPTPACVFSSTALSCTVSPTELNTS